MHTKIPECANMTTINTLINDQQKLIRLKQNFQKSYKAKTLKAVSKSPTQYAHSVLSVTCLGTFFSIPFQRIWNQPKILLFYTHVDLESFLGQNSTFYNL